ncbi:MAG: PAS domain-containing protein, partial [Planctomycetota bacterium]
MAKATYLLRKAAELVKEKRYQDAVEVYLQATETDPSDARAWFGLGVCLYKVANLDVARIALERAQRMGYPRADEALARVEAAEQKRSANGRGAKATIAPAEAKQRAALRPKAQHEPPPRPLVRPEHEKIDLDRYLRVMLVENIETDRQAVSQAIEGTIKHAKVNSVEYGVSTSDTMSGTVHYDAAVLDWDTAPDAATGLIKILKIKRPAMLVICLTEKWDPESAVEILEAGADYHLVKEPHFASAIPLILAQWTRRDSAVVQQQAGRSGEGPAAVWPQALDALDEALVLVGADLTILQANQTAMKQFKKGEEEFVGKAYCDIFYGEDEPPESCPVLHALEKGEPATDDLRHEALGKAFRLQAWPVMSYAGKVSSAIALVHEKGDEERAAESLQSREWLYRNLTEKAGGGVAMVGPDGRMHYANRAVCTMLDQTEEELIGRRIEDFLPPQELEALRECLNTAVARGEAGERLVLQRADGSTFPAETRVASFATAEGTCLVLTILGVEELEAAEQELWSETRKWTMVLDKGVDQLKCGVVVLDDAGRVTWANSRAAELLGQSKEAILGADYVKVVGESVADAQPEAREFVDTLGEAHKRGETIEGQPLQIGNETLSYSSTPAHGSPAASRVEHFHPAGDAISTELLVPAGQEGFAGIAAALPEMLFTADTEGKITWCNPA